MGFIHPRWCRILCINSTIIFTIFLLISQTLIPRGHSCFFGQPCWDILAFWSNNCRSLAKSIPRMKTWAVSTVGWLAWWLTQCRVWSWTWLLYGCCLNIFFKLRWDEEYVIAVNGRNLAPPGMYNFSSKKGIQLPTSDAGFLPAAVRNLLRSYWLKKTLIACLHLNTGFQTNNTQPIYQMNNQSTLHRYTYHIQVWSFGHQTTSMKPLEGPPQ